MSFQPRKMHLDGERLARGLTPNAACAWRSVFCLTTDGLQRSSATTVDYPDLGHRPAVDRPVIRPWMLIQAGGESRCG